ncbi:LysR family transcriptional regulator [Aeromonas hydrophila]|uniref:LysR family transcriptional regulator n=1 Tax=Aeromonas hydrophila TaxID=644 RepID=UPI001117A552|nr:LysR family transcriptional regulator [Aeromonas hydrophila]MCP3325668.1 LysR family transcriptional regulator [Aeromonas hydrophila]TNH87025.1 LysR family transcriptional regulator [Aeromonas hydrophila]
MDRLTSMRIFTRVVDLGSYSAVASEEGISAQMVGKHVQGLEQWLGGKLFHKTTRQQALTELGQLFLARCQRVLEELALTESLTQHLLAEPAGRLRIAAPLSFGHHRLVPLLPAFLDRYPKLEVDLQLTPRWVDLVEEGFDAAIRTLRPQDEARIARPLLTQRYRLCAAPDYLARHGVPRQPADLARHQCLHGNWGEHERWQFVGGDGQSEEVRVASRLRINHWPALLTAALAGAGISLQPADQVQGHIAAGRLLPLLDTYRIPDKTLHFIYPAARRQVLKITLLGDFLAEALADKSPQPA